MGIASLVLGIVSCLLCLVFPLGFPFILIMGSIGSIFGFIGSKEKAKLATAGLVVSLVPTLLSLLILIIFIV